MDVLRTGTESRDARFDGLHAEASAAVGYSANSLRAVREQYRTGLAEANVRSERLRREIEAIERRRAPGRMASTKPALEGAPNSVAMDDPARASEAEQGADAARLQAVRSESELLMAEIETRQVELSRLELAQRTLERTWLFLKQDDSSLVAENDGHAMNGDVAMRIVEAVEGERSRLAQEVHDGPAQALANAIFQVEYIEGVVDSEPALAKTELRHLREILRRELGDVRSFITQLRPPVLDELGLDGALRDAVEHVQALTGLAIELSLEAPADDLGDGPQVVVLRVIQESLQNVRKHAAANRVVVATRVEDGEWVAEVRDDGRGFDAGAVAARGRQRNFGLQFMRERADLIGARLDVRSRPDGGTVVRLAIPRAQARGAEEST